MLAMAVVLSLSSAFATTVYCKMTQSWWTTDGAAVGVHYWGGASAGTKWPGVRMPSVTGEEGMWSYDVPSDVTGLVFVRVNGSGDVTDWGAKTKDLTLPTDGKNLFTITNSSPTWGSPGCDGEWSTYAPVVSTVTYTALTAAPTTGNWAGQYLIVWADNKAHATVNPSGSDLAATSDELTITAGEIEINSTDAYYVIVEPFAEGYSIKLPSGKYLSVNASSNKVAAVNDPYSFNFEYTASGIKIFGKDTKGDFRYVMNNSTYYRGYKWNDSYKLPTLYRTGDEAPALQTLYFVNVLDWTKVNAFVWPATGDAYKPWSGEAMYKTADQVKGKDIYAYRFPATFVNAIFNNGTDQTADLVWDATKPYFVPGAKNAAGKYEGTWYASKDDIPVPGKYYITGDSALVVDAGLAADKAWAPAAIKANADTTVLNLKKGVEYKLKVTVDGTWATALGYNALSEKTEGLIADGDDNICFKLSEAGAVQVIYFKEGDVVTFKVLGNFYIKPVIVETLKLVPNMWSEAGAKMAAWVWGEGLAGAWTPFFAGEGDTLSVKINAEADSIIFVRMNSDATEPDWSKEWNRVNNEEIDHVGLTYTITDWDKGQWTPYEPAGGCDWDNLPWLGSALPAYAEQFKICLGDPKPGVVNIQESFGTQAGIYVTFPSAAFGQISLSEGQYAIQGAGMLLYVSAFTAKETEVSVVCENVEYVFTIYNDKGGEPVCKDKYGLKVGDNVVEFTKNEAQTEWTEYYKQGVELTQGQFIALYNICEETAFTATIAGYEGFTPATGGWTVTETAKYDFYLKLIYGADELYVVKQGSGDTKFYMKNNWNAGADWTWKEMTKDGDNYKLENVVFGGSGVNYNTSETDEGAAWVEVADILGDKIAAKDTVTFVLNPTAKTVTATIVGKYIPTGDVQYFMKNNWNAGADWTWKEMTKDGDNYKLENVVYGGTGVNYNTEATDANATWVAEADIKGDKLGAKDTVNLVLNPVAGTVTATIVGKYVDPTPGDKVYTIVGVADLVGVEWNPEATDNDMAKQADGSYKLVKENVALASGAYEYKVVEGHVWTGWQIPAEGNQSLTIDAAGVYNVTFTLDAALTTLTVTATNVGPMPEQEYGLMIDGTTFIKAQPNPATANEYMVLDVALTAGQTLQIYDKTNEVGWAIEKWNEGSYKFEIKDNKYIVSETAKYDFYVNLEYGNDYIYVAKKEGPSAIENLVAPANEMRKVMIDGKLYILRDGKVYSVQGQLIR